MTDSPHLAIIGGGSAAFAAAIKANEIGARVTMINAGLPIGGTCVNVGCVPSKALIRAAGAHYLAIHHNFRGVESQSRITSFRDVVEQKRELIAQMRQSKYLDIVSGLEDVRLVKGRARIAGPGAVEVSGERIAADFILVATGASPAVPPVPGIEESGYLTSDTAFDLDELPDSLVILGGRYIALETAQMFSRFGSRVTVLQRSKRILPTETADITGALTRILEEEGMEVVTGVSLEKVKRDGGKTAIAAQVDGNKRIFHADALFVATGRRPNTENLGLEEVGARLDTRGFLKVDDALRTDATGIYGAGDVIGQPMFVYTAAYEGALAAENALAGTSRKRDYTALPWVIFTDPQVAGVGLDERQAGEKGLDAEHVVLPLSQVPRCLAAHDTTGFIKLVRDRSTDKLVGARILAREGAELLMEISLAIKWGVTTRQLASSFHPYLTLSEGVKLAAVSFRKEIDKLSCCAD